MEPSPSKAISNKGLMTISNIYIAFCFLQTNLPLCIYIYIYKLKIKKKKKKFNVELDKLLISRQE